MTQVQAQVKNQIAEQRRYDVDWLRTLAFTLLILYHVGMYYVADWDWHIKSSQQSVWLQDFMILTNQWRMSLLFLISGIALSLVLEQNKFSRWHLGGLRTNRLLVPLIFSMYLIVPPQLFYELQQQHGLTLNYWEFLQEYWNVDTSLAPFKQSSIGLFTWNHLWFLPYLWVYSLVVLLLFPLFNKLGKGLHKLNLPLWLVFGFLVMAMSLIWVSLRESYPVTHALLDDWYSHAKYFLAFVFGVFLPFVQNVWQQIIKHRRVFLAIAILGYSWLMLDRHGFLDIGDELDGLIIIKLIHGVLLSLNYWSWILLVVAYAGHYLNFTNRFLTYANQAILPWYIFHQTLIVVFAIYLLPFNLDAYTEAPLLILMTCLGCLIGYEVVRRFVLLRWLFGLKVVWVKRPKTPTVTEHA
jgi:peptidoglycan/LPS O-acetylase OafA/YrhL